VKIRPAQPNDGPAIGRLIYDTVHQVNRRDYSEEQVKAWAPSPEALSRAYEKGEAFVAVIGEQIVGFGNLLSDGHLHHLYVHNDFQGQGVGSLLLEALEEKARSMGLHYIRTEASITAKPFFLEKGYVLEEEQVKVRRGVSFINFKMRKRLL
jgi:putative acetyltransferase